MCRVLSPVYFDALVGSEIQERYVQRVRLAAGCRATSQLETGEVSHFENSGWSQRENGTRPMGSWFQENRGKRGVRVDLGCDLHRVKKVTKQSATL